MKTIEMEIALMEYFDFTQKHIVPNITNMSTLANFEVDMLVLSKSNYATGIEIKVSKADLKKDFDKRRFKLIEKHPMMMNKFYMNLKYFYYAVPEKLKDYALEMIPDYAGLLVAKNVRDKIKIQLIKEPKLIGDKKWSNEMVYDLLRLGTMRIYNLKRRIKKLS